MLVALLVLYYTAAFRGLYILTGRVTSMSPAARSRLVSCVHAVALSLLGALAVRAPELVGAPWWLAAARELPLAYLAHDAHLIWAEPAFWDPAMLAHHFAFAALAAAGVEAYPGLAARAFLAEISTPLLHAGWAMHRSGADLRWPRAFGALSAALLLAFFVFRVCLLAALALESARLSEWLGGLLMAGLTALNWYWFYLLARRASQHLASARPAGLPRPRHRKVE